jgi:N-glycosylase/DNA lyase
MKEIVIDTKCFNLKYTLECGQCFRWKNVDDTYVGVIQDRVIKIRQSGNKLYVRSNNMDSLEEVVTSYFDLNLDYSSIETEISKIDLNVEKAVKNTTGLRLLNQAFFETLISYIISANNNIPRISKSVETISKLYGKKIIFEDEEYYLFPSAEELKNVDVDDFRKCGVGFRDKYILNAVKDIINGKIDINNIDNISTVDLRKILMTIQGVGPKVADCILLFACCRKEVFPVDVWVERVMNLIYFKDVEKSMSKNEIILFANEKFGKYAGIVQEHLFLNIREKMI